MDDASASSAEYLLSLLFKLAQKSLAAWRLPAKAVLSKSSKVTFQDKAPRVY